MRRALASKTRCGVATLRNSVPRRSKTDPDTRGTCERSFALTGSARAGATKARTDVLREVGGMEEV